MLALPASLHYTTSKNFFHLFCILFLTFCFLSMILVFSLTLSLVVPASAASSTIGVTSSLDTGSVGLWTSYFTSKAMDDTTVNGVGFWDMVNKFLGITSNA